MPLIVVNKYLITHQWVISCQVQPSFAHWAAATQEFGIQLIPEDKQQNLVRQVMNTSTIDTATVVKVLCVHHTEFVFPITQWLWSVDNWFKTVDMQMVRSSISFIAVCNVLTLLFQNLIQKWSFWWWVHSLKGEYIGACSQESVMIEKFSFLASQEVFCSELFSFLCNLQKCVQVQWIVDADARCYGLIVLLRNTAERIFVGSRGEKHRNCPSIRAINRLIQVFIELKHKVG